MKKTCLLSLFFWLGCLAAVAQYESFFGQQTWSYNIVYPITCKTDDYNLFGCCNTYSFSFDKTSVVYIGDTMYYQGYNDYVYSQIYLREDSMNGRLYGRYPLDEYEKEYLICDLSLSVGDTFILHDNIDYGHELFWFQYEQEGSMRVDSITYSLGGKVIHMSRLTGNDFFFPVGNYNVSYRFMEGIGPILGICPHGIYHEPSSGFLLCMQKDGELFYMTHADLGCYQYGADIKEYPQTHVNIYPNPANKTFTISFTEEQESVKQVRVMDIMGKVVMSVENPSGNTVNIAKLPAGIYAVRVLSQSGISYTVKLVKE